MLINPVNIHTVQLHYLTSFHFSRETFIEREPGESANDRNDRAIRVAAKWYSEHLKRFQADGDKLRVVLLTNDLGNKQKAEENNLLVYKCKRLFPNLKYLCFWCNISNLLDYILGEEYIKSLIANPELVDRLALSSDDKVNMSTVMTVYRCPGGETPEEILSYLLVLQSFIFFLFFLRMTSPVIRCYSQSTSPCQRSKRELRMAPSSRAPLGQAGTTIWRPQSLSTEKGKMAQRCVNLLSSQ